MNRKSTILATLTACAVVLSSPLRLAAQDETKTAKTEKTKAASPAIVLETSEMMIAMGLLDQFGSDDKLPDLGEKEHYVLTVMSDKTASVKKSDTKVGWVEVTLHPPALMELFKDEIDANWDMASGGAIMVMTQQMGLTTKNAAEVMKAVRGFPNQIKTITIGLSSNPQTEFKGMKAALSITPVADSWMGKLVRNLRPNSQGMPRLAGKDALIRVGTAIEPEGLNTFAKPFLELIAGIGAKNKKERERNLILYTKLANAQDGSFYAVGNPFNGGLRTAGGVRDAKGLAEMVHSPDYGKLVETTGNLSPLVETEYQPVAFKHREVSVAKTTVTTDIDTPLQPAGDRITFTAVAGDFMISTIGLKQDETKKLIDSALDQKIKRSPLPGNSLFFMDIQLMDLLDMVVPFGNPLAGDENAPEKVHVSSSSKDGTIHIHMGFK